MLIRLYETAISKDPDRNAAARLFLDRTQGPTIHALAIQHSIVGGPITALLREIAASERLLTSGAVTVEAESGQLGRELKP